MRKHRSSGLDQCCHAVEVSLPRSFPMQNHPTNFRLYFCTALLQVNACSHEVVVWKERSIQSVDFKSAKGKVLLRRVYLVHNCARNENGGHHQSQWEYPKPTPTPTLTPTTTYKTTYRHGQEQQQCQNNRNSDNNDKNINTNTSLHTKNTKKIDANVHIEHQDRYQ